MCWYLNPSQWNCGHSGTVVPAQNHGGLGKWEAEEAIRLGGTADGDKRT
jgi:hypothetical protein